jgi:site-specific DNA recombinase
MTSTNGYDPKQAILYARVSTEEQARSGYSLAQQVEALRAYADREGYEVLEEVMDPGQSGASLERPGMDRVRDLVTVGGVSMVLAQDRDRFAREPAFLYLLRQEFAEHGTSIRALNDRGDGSPEGELTDGILDQLAKYERAKMFERTRRGTLRRAREGKIIPRGGANYGFAYDETKEGFVVVEENMAVVRRIFHMVGVEGMALHAVEKRLEAEGVQSPTGKARWDRRLLRRFILNDVYKPHTFEKLEELVSPEVANRLDPGKLYGIWWYQRRRYVYKRVVEDGPHGRTYRRSGKSIPRPPNEQIAIPVPDAGIPREVVGAAREAVKNNRRKSRNGGRLWELSGGISRCGECGWAIRTSSVTRKGKQYSYYHCSNAHSRKGCDHGKHYRAAELEEKVWAFVSDLLKNPDRLLEGLEEMIEEVRGALRGDPDREAKVWLDKLVQIDRKRSAYQDQQAEGLITLDELRAKLAALEETRETAHRELVVLKGYRERIEELERDAEALLEHYAMLVPQDLDNLTPEERHNVYKMMQLKVSVRPGGTPEATWAFGGEPIVCRSETAARTAPRGRVHLGKDPSAGAASRRACPCPTPRRPCG